MPIIHSVRAHRAIILVLLLVIAGLVYKFIVAGSTERLADGRIAVVLAPAERDLVLREMRGFVEGTQAMTAALARNDLKAAATAARAMGTTRAHDAPASLFAKLPLEFKTLALGLHRGFDALAADAEAGGTAQHALEQLGGVLQGCVACHATFVLQDAASSR